MAKTKGGAGSGSNQPPKKKGAKLPPPKRTTRQTASEETSTKIAEDPLLEIQPEDKGHAEVLQQEEREVARAAAESTQPEEGEPELTPPVKKSKKAQASRATPARSTVASPPVQAQPQPQIPEISVQEGRTASEDTEEEEQEKAEEEKSEEEKVDEEEDDEAEEVEAVQEKEVEIPTPQSKRPGVKRKLDVAKPPLPVKAKPAPAGSKTRTKAEQSKKPRKPTAAEKGKAKEMEEPMEVDPERTETVDSSKSEEVLAPKKTTSSTTTTAKPKLAKQKGLLRTTASEVVIPRESQRYAVLQNREITPWYFLVTEALEDLGIKEKVEGYFEGIGWKKILEWNPKAYQKLMEEFMGTVEFKPKGNYTIETPGTLRFQMQGRIFPLSINELNIHLGVIEATEVYDETITGHCYLPEASMSKTSANRTRSGTPLCRSTTGGWPTTSTARWKVPMWSPNRKSSCCGA
ncbi:uncharacterized protein LOC131006760 [Salvia miltiorrhiza]|uniref:uncharacterized protein LOC131006760 n=1 Tax=Salvia miltiorrhiza TaxID=226208 RepID=UPI0025ACB2FA|nr:uncharacterized protein LOC131006760 [Salvia miltiorrhiza]